MYLRGRNFRSDRQQTELFSAYAAFAFVGAIVLGVI
jgi:hypothetical protein